MLLRAGAGRFWPLNDGRRPRLAGLLGLALIGALLAACGGAGPDLPAATATPTQQVRLGRELFRRECAACHSIFPETIIVGPSLNGIAGRAGQRVAGQDAAAYILHSILRPGDFLAPGYENLMPTTLGKDLTGEEIDAIIAYLLTL